LLLVKDNEGETACHYASYGGNVGKLQKLWECGKMALTAEKLKNILSLTKDNEGETACHYASYEGN
jgi:ankyrin repeat protein